MFIKESEFANMRRNWARMAAAEEIRTRTYHGASGFRRESLPDYNSLTLGPAKILLGINELGTSYQVRQVRNS